MNKWAVRRFTIAAQQAETVPDKASWTRSSFLQKTDEQWAVQRLTMHHRRQKARLMGSIGLNRHFLHTPRPS